MAGTMTDFKVYPREFFGGLQESLTQNLQLFNGASNGAVNLVPRDIRGEFERESFMKKLSSNIAHRDPTADTSVSDSKMEQGELVGVKVNRRIGPNAMTIDSWKKIDSDPQRFSFYYGQQTAEDVMEDYVNTAILVGRTTIEQQSANLVYDATGEADPKLRHEYLIRGMSNFGDRSRRIGVWVMHSVPFFNLLENAVLEKVTNVADVAIYGGGPGTFDRPVIVTDSDALVDDSNPSNLKYYTLGLSDDAVEIAQSEDEAIWDEQVLGYENLKLRIQGEYAFNARAKGFAYTGSANPNDAALGNTSNWGFQMTSVKDSPGIAILTSEQTVT